MGPDFALGDLELSIDSSDYWLAGWDEGDFVSDQVIPRDLNVPPSGCSSSACFLDNKQLEEKDQRTLRE